MVLALGFPGRVLLLCSSRVSCRRALGVSLCSSCQAVRVTETWVAALMGCTVWMGMATHKSGRRLVREAGALWPPLGAWLAATASEEVALQLRSQCKERVGAGAPRKVCAR